MIDSITLENWKTHKASTLRFGKGTNVLVGVIGSGKSSVMDGLCYGLFGTFPAVHSHRVSVSDLLMRKPFSADQGRVEVNFTVGEKKYKVERILKREGINEGRLWCNDTLIAGPKPNQVTERVEKELNVSYELFTRAVYSEQNQVDYFLKLNPGDRKKKFDELLELQKYEGVRANAMQIINQFRRQEETHAQSLSQFDALLQNQDLNELRLNVSIQHQKLAALAERKEHLTKDVETKKARAAFLEQSLAKANALKEQFQRAETQRDALLGRIEATRTQFPAEMEHPHAHWASEKTRLTESAAQLVQRQSQFRAAEAEVQKQGERIRGLESRGEVLATAFGGRTPASIENDYLNGIRAQESARKAVEASQKESTNGVANRRIAEQAIVSLFEEQKSLSALHASCPTCKQGISSEHKNRIHGDLEAKMRQRNTEFEAAEAALKRIEAERRVCEVTLRAAEEENRTLSLLREKAREFISLQNDHALASAALSKAQHALSGLGSGNSAEEMVLIQSRLGVVDKMLEFHALSTQAAALAEQAARFRSDFTALGVNPEHVMQAVQARSEAQSALANVDHEFALEKKLLGELSARVESVEKVAVQQQLVRDKKTRAADVQQSLSVFSNVLVETQQQLRETVVGAINAALLELWPWLYPYKDFTLAKVHVQDNDYVLMVQERNGNWVAAESSLSGGERSAAALTLRMAIAFVLTRQLSWMILDEPTHNLDVKSVATLSEVLKSRLPDLVDQVFVITHSSEIEKSATGSLYELQREKNEDGCTIPVAKSLLSRVV